MEPLENCPRETLANIRGILTDIDDTVSSDGTLTTEAYGALQALKRAGLLVVPVTGRPAGWCDHIARFWPVDAVVGENGAFWMWHDRSQKRLRTRFIQSEAERAGIASDQPYRLADLAVDFCEDVPPLPSADIKRIAAIFERHGAKAKVSSIHVNGWFGDYDKLTTSRTMMQELFGIDLAAEKARYVFSGDSPNDAPMFGYFPNAVGVANVVDFAELLEHRPRWVTKSRSGAGFVELATALLTARG
jgi:hydroxymethylpyrimidine pyrophosphatase-like HAD family hydrolase